MRKPTMTRMRMPSRDSDRLGSTARPANRPTPRAHPCLPRPGCPSRAQTRRTLRRTTPSQHSPPERLESGSGTDSWSVRLGPAHRPGPARPHDPSTHPAPHSPHPAAPAPAPGEDQTSPSHAIHKVETCRSPDPSRRSRGMQYRVHNRWFRWDGGSGLGRGRAKGRRGTFGAANSAEDVPL
jgi:hypothetical protein